MNTSAPYPIRTITPSDQYWPENLRCMGKNMPERLWVLGDVETLTKSNLIAFTGLRAATQYGITIANTFAYELAKEGNPIVSGGAFGIEIAANRGALKANGPTVVVSPSGLNNLYPVAHHEIFGEIIQAGGAIVSAYEPNTRPSRSNFLQRNTLVAALSSATVVVEAARRSGAMHTAREATALKRPVGAVPGRIDSHASAGTHALIRMGAQLIQSSKDVLEMLNS